MKTTKEILDTVVEKQTKAVNNFVETANKFQEAFNSGKAFEKSTEIYNDWLKSQMSEFKDITTEAKDETEDVVNTTAHKVEDFYKNIYQTQLDAIKKATEFHLNTSNSLFNFGKPATETTASYTNVYNNWNTLYESWANTLNTSYDSLNKVMPTTTGKDFFENAFKANNAYNKIQDFYKPYFNAIQNNNYSVDNFKNMFNPSEYKKITEDLYSNFFHMNNLNTIIENNTKTIQDFVTSQQTTNKEFQNYWNTFTEKFPHLVSGDFVKFIETYKTTNNTFGEFFAPMLKLVNNAKEKENLELAIDTLDKTTLYSTKLAQLQYLIYTAGQSVAQESIKTLTEKMNDTTFTTSFQPFFNEWVTLNEKTYSDLYATTEFSKLKAEVTTLSLEVKRNIEKQFENRIEHLPLVVKSEMNEIYQTIHDLKNTIKTLENTVHTLTNGTTATTEDNTTAKTATTKTTTTKKTTTV